MEQWTEGWRTWGGRGRERDTAQHLRRRARLEGLTLVSHGCCRLDSGVYGVCKCICRPGVVALVIPIPPPFQCRPPPPPQSNPATGAAPQKLATPLTRLVNKSPSPSPPPPPLLRVDESDAGVNICPRDHQAQFGRNIGGGTRCTVQMLMIESLIQATSCCFISLCIAS